MEVVYLTAATVSGGTRVGVGILGRTLGLAGKIIEGLLKLITFPLRKGTFISRLFFLVLYTLGILYVLSEYTTLLDAWL